MSVEQALALWRTQLPLYKRILDRLRDTVLTPLTRFLPPHFEEKKQQLRGRLEIGDMENYEEFLDVIVEHIEGVYNKSIIQLADRLTSQMGGNIKFWQDAIVDVADYVDYSDNFRIWEVRKVFQSHLYVDPQNLSRHRRVAKLAKVYLAALVNITKYINKFDPKKDSISRIDDLYKKVKSAEDKYLSYIEDVGVLDHSATMDELSNKFSQVGKQNAIKDLYNFAQPKKSKQQKSTKNTLLNYKFTKERTTPSERVEIPSKNIKFVNQKLVGEGLDQFQSYYNTISSNCIDVNYLRCQLQRPLPPATLQPHLTTIWDKDYFFSYLGYEVQLPQRVNYLDATVEYTQVNYELGSEDEFQQLLGEDVGNQSEISSVSSLSHAGSFIVSDDHLSEDEALDKEKIEPKPSLNAVFGERWTFSRGDKTPRVESGRLISISKEANFPLPIFTDQNDQILTNIVSGKDRKQINSAVEKKCLAEGIVKISRRRIDEFLKKNCKQVKDRHNPSKKVFILLEEDEKKEESENFAEERKSLGKESDADNRSPQPKEQEQEILENAEPETEAEGTRPLEPDTEKGRNDRVNQENEQKTNTEDSRRRRRNLGRTRSGSLGL